MHACAHTHTHTVITDYPLTLSHIMSCGKRYSDLTRVCGTDGGRWLVQGLIAVGPTLVAAGGREIPKVLATDHFHFQQAEVEAICQTKPEAVYDGVMQHAGGVGKACFAQQTYCVRAELLLAVALQRVS